MLLGYMHGSAEARFTVQRWIQSLRTSDLAVCPQHTEAEPWTVAMIKEWL